MRGRVPRAAPKRLPFSGLGPRPTFPLLPSGSSYVWKRNRFRAYMGRYVDLFWREVMRRLRGRLQNSPSPQNSAPWRPPPGLRVYSI
jgi:hypothetical protein